jgi:hypothetical protein
MAATLKLILHIFMAFPFGTQPWSAALWRFGAFRCQSGDYFGRKSGES